MSKSKKAARSIAVIVLFSFGSKFLGFIRETLIAAKFGSGLETDTFFIAISAITLFTNMITISINTTMIPLLSEIEAKEGKDSKINHTNNILNIVFLISFILMILALLSAPFFIRIIASGFKGRQFKLAILMMRIGLPSILFASVQGVLRGYLQSEMMFTESAVAMLPFNLVYILFLIFAASKFDIKALMMVSVIAVATQVMVQYPSLRKSGFRYKFVVNFKDTYVRRIMYLIPPVLASAGIEDLNNIVDKSMASSLVSGSISSLQYANRLNNIIRGTFISAITTVIYPMFSQDANSDNYNGLKKTIIYSINIILLITIPATIGIIVLAHPIVKVAFERDAFDSTATYMTASALVFYSIGLVATSMKSMVNRVYYSLQDTRTPMTNSLIALSTNIVLNFLFVKSMGHKGLALATSTSAILTSLLLLYKLKQKIGSFGFVKSIKCGLKSFIASIIMGLSVYFIDCYLANIFSGHIISELIVLLISIALGMLIYLILIYILRVEEINWVIKFAKDKLAKSVRRIRLN